MNGSATRSEVITAPIGAYAEVSPFAVVIMSGTHVEALDAEVVAEAAPGADHLVGDQQDVVLVADLADALPVAVLRHEAAARVLHRLEDHRGDRLRALELDHVLDLVRGPERVAVLGPAVLVRVRHVVRAGHERLERRCAAA